MNYQSTNSTQLKQESHGDLHSRGFNTQGFEHHINRKKKTGQPKKQGRRIPKSAKTKQDQAITIKYAQNNVITAESMKLE